MDIRLIRQLWSTVEAFPSGQLSSLDDSSLLTSIVEALQTDPAFESGDISTVSRYIQARMPLIRDAFQYS